MVSGAREYPVEAPDGLVLRQLRVKTVQARFLMDLIKLKASKAIGEELMVAGAAFPGILTMFLLGCRVQRRGDWLLDGRYG